MFMLMFSLKFAQCDTMTQTESNQEVTKKMTDKHAAEYSKTVCSDVNQSVRDV